MELSALKLLFFAAILISAEATSSLSSSSSVSQKRKEKASDETVDKSDVPENQKWIQEEHGIMDYVELRTAEFRKKLLSEINILLQPLIDSKHQFEETVKEIRTTLENEPLIKACAKNEVTALETLVKEYSNLVNIVSGYFESSKKLELSKLGTENQPLSYATLSQLQGLAIFKSVVHQVVTFQAENVIKSCRIKIADENIKRLIESKFEKINGLLEQIEIDTINKLSEYLTKRQDIKALSKEAKGAPLFPFDETLLGGSILRGDGYDVASRVTQMTQKKRRTLKADLYRLCSGLTVTLCRESLEEDYPESNDDDSRKQLLKTIYPSIDFEEIAHAFRKAVWCANLHEEYRQSKSRNIFGKIMDDGKKSEYPMCSVML